MHSIVLWTTLILGASSTFAIVVSPENSIVWGPGLYANVHVPARYFYIQPVDLDGNNVTESLGHYPFSIYLVKQGTDTAIRSWIQQLDRLDGSYIVRYKLYTSHADLKLVVQYNDNNVAGAPYLLKGPLHHENCYCPDVELSAWYNKMSCPNSYEQIDKDLSAFPEDIDMHTVVDEAISRFSNAGAHSLCHYVVKDNQVYRRRFGEHVGFSMFVDAILLSLTRKVKLPDVEFLMNLGDWPLEKRDVNPLPIFSWCGSDSTADIVLPTYDITESVLQTMSRVSLDMLSVQGHSAPNWSNRTDKLFWRGRDSRQERLDLVVMSRKYPELIDAKLTNMFFFKKDPELYGDIVQPVSFLEFFQHKYQMNIDGTVAAYRMPYLMGGSSVILKQQSPFYEFFYHKLKPFEHYIPVARDLSDVLEMLDWAKKHDKQSQKIARNALEFMRENLQATDILCYHVKAFEAFSKRLKHPPHVRDDMEHVSQPDQDSSCVCEQKAVQPKHTLDVKEKDKSGRDEL